MTKAEENRAIELVNGDFQWERGKKSTAEQVLLGMIAHYRSKLHEGNDEFPWANLIQVALRRVNREPPI